MIDVYNESYQNGSLPESQRMAVMSLIFKKGDEENIKNYRPISLTNVDYRILAVTLAQRVQKVIGNIISNDQTAYIKGRYMDTNIRLVSDVIDYFDMMEESGFLLMLDFKKAFDSIEWNFLLRALRYFNFGPTFIKWVETIYSKPEACIKNNGHISDTFKISRGIRQGCPVSALLFITCVEILGIKVRSSQCLAGFNFGYPQKPIKISQYADDAIMFMNDRNEMCSALNILEKFGDVSGLILNVEKCEGFWLGEKMQQENCNLFGIKWPEQFRCLGIYLGYNRPLNDIRNWYEKLDDIEITLKKWKDRNLSLFGRVQILKTFGLSKLILPASTIVIPKDIVKKIDKIFYKFLWKSTDKVKRNKVIHSVEQGGLAMINTQAFLNSLVANWTNRILEADPNLHGWVQLSRMFLKSFDFNGLCVLFNFDDSVLFSTIEQLPPFYKAMLICYNKAFVSSKVDFINTIMNQPLWGNKYITKMTKGKKNVLFLRNWIRSGIRKVGDLIFTDGILDENCIYQRLIGKQNVYSEITIVMEALRPYQQNLIEMQTIEMHRRALRKSRDFYQIYLQQILDSIGESSRDYLNRYNITRNDDIYRQVFTNKVKIEKEIKLKEFNFKLLHGILPCNKNLEKWKIRANDKCDVCGSSQTIDHLLYYCNYVRPLWRLVERKVGIIITFEQILGLDPLFEYDSITTIIGFLIYKEWLLLSLENKQRNAGLNMMYYKSELQLRTEIYKLCKCIDQNHVDNLMELISFM